MPPRPEATQHSTQHSKIPSPDLSLGMADITRFLNHHRITHIEAVVPDVAGIARGKLIPRTQFELGEPMRLPQVALLQSISGEAVGDVSQTGFTDADMVCIPDATTICRLPWASRPTAQIIHDCTQFDGTPMGIAPRQVLQRVLQCYAAKGWLPVVAPELEFFLVDTYINADMPLRPAAGRSRRREEARQPYSLEAINEFAPFVETLYTYCEAQGLAVNTLIHETGAAQMEINFPHGDALQLADSVFCFKRTAREAATPHDLFVTFMAKPLEDEPGSAMHVHQSIVDAATGQNLFCDKDGGPNALFGSYIAGLQRYAPALMPIFAPYANSYRRLSRYLAAPINLQWGYDNRTAGFRIPKSSPESLRIENRLPGVDTNPYLVLAGTLAAGYLGMTEGLAATAPITANAHCMACQLPHHVEEGLASMGKCDTLAALLGEDFVKAYIALKEIENASFLQSMTPWEREHLLVRI